MSTDKPDGPFIRKCRQTCRYFVDKPGQSGTMGRVEGTTSTSVYLVEVLSSLKCGRQPVSTDRRLVKCRQKQVFLSSDILVQCPRLSTSLHLYFYLIRGTHNRQAQP